MCKGGREVKIDTENSRQRTRNKHSVGERKGRREVENNFLKNKSEDNLIAQRSKIDIGQYIDKEKEEKKQRESMKSKRGGPIR